MEFDTIASVATPPGTGGIAVIRVSGPEAPQILERVFTASGPFEHGRMIYGSVVRDGTVIDSGYAVLFRAPKSYTGEDTAELQIHGGQVTTAMVLDAVIAAGARPAEPGEFTKRAFLNGRIDLAQAEAVGDLIGALSEAGAKLAVRQTRDLLRTELESIADLIKDIVAHTEAVLEYPDEDIDISDAESDAKKLHTAADRLTELAETASKGRIIRDGLRVTLAGAPNAGKSSLFNVLCGENAAIVTATPGTTRDCLKQTISVNGAAVHLSDTAGLRTTDDEIEQEGVLRSVNAASESDLILFVIDGSSPISDTDKEAWDTVCGLGVPVVCALSKSDLDRRTDAAEAAALTGAEECISVSAVSGEGIEAVTDLLYKLSCADALRTETVLLSDMRQKRHLRDAAETVRGAAELFASGMDADCACLDLKGALREIGSVTGEYADEEIIDRIFSKFCLGK